MRKILIFSFIVIITATAGYFLFFKNSKSERSSTPKDLSFGKLATQVEGLILKPEKLSHEIEVSGTILPYEETTLISEVPGKIVKVNIIEGKPVEKGNLLVKLFDEDLQAQLKMLEVQLKIAENNELRMRTLFNVKGTSQQEYDASLLQVNNLKAQIEILKVNIGKTEIRAPYSGVIGLKKVSIGQYVNTSNQIATIRDVHNLKLDFSIPEQYGSYVTSGSKITFLVTGQDAIYEATVIATESSIESESRNLNVRAIISSNTSKIIPGSFAKVKVNLGTKEDAILIPTSSIVPQASDKKVYVYRNEKAAFVSIKTGVREATDIEVVSGLKAGDTIVVSGILFIKPNSPVKFVKVR